MANLERNAKKFKLYSKVQKNIRPIIKQLGKLPFLDIVDDNYIDNVLNDITVILIEKKVDKIYIEDFNKYYNNTWKHYYKKGILNYKGMEKFRRSNSYIEL